MELQASGVTLDEAHIGAPLPVDTDGTTGAVGNEIEPSITPWDILLGPDATRSPMRGVTRYEIRDATGELVAVHVRRDDARGKQLRWERPDGEGGSGGVAVRDLPLYGAHMVVAWDPDEPIVVTEGEKAADALRAIGVRALGTVTGAASSPDRSALEVLRNRHVVLWPDEDDIGRRHMRQIAARLEGIAASVSWLQPDGMPDGGDAADAVAEWRPEAIRLAVEQAPSVPLDIPSAHRDGVRAERKFAFRTAREIGAGVEAETRWAVRPWFPLGSVVEVSGRVKAAGKTTWLMHACRRALDGLPFMGEPTQNTVVVYLTEQNRPSLRTALARVDLLDRDDFLMLEYSETVGAAWPAIVEAAATECAERAAALGRYGMVVVDTIGRFARLPADAENDAGQADALLEPLQLAVARYSLAAVLVRHERKGGGEVGESARGSTAFAGAVDIVLRIRSLARNEGGQRPTMRVIEALSRFDETPSERFIELTDEGYVALGNGNEVAFGQGRERLLEELGRAGEEGVDRDELAKWVNLPRETARRILDGLLSGGSVERSGRGVKGDPYRWRLANRRFDSPPTGGPWAESNSTDEASAAQVADAAFTSADSSILSAQPLPHRDGIEPRSAPISCVAYTEHQSAHRKMSAGWICGICSGGDS